MALISSYVFSLLRVSDEKIALIDSDTGEQLTRRGVLERSQRISQYLSAFGYGSGDIIAYFSSNCADFVCFVLGIIDTGAAVAFGNPSFTESEIKSFLEMTSPSCVIYNRARTNNTIQQVASQSVKCLSTSEVMTESSQLVLSTLEPGEKLAGGRDHLAFICLSSGTSGFPKAAMISHHAFMLQLQHGLTFDKDYHTMLLILPMYHMYALIFMLRIMCSRNSSMVTVSKFSPLAMTDNIKRYQITLLPIVPSLFLPLIKSDPEDLKSLKLVLMGGAPFNPTLVSNLLNRFSPGSLEIYNIYGITEAGIFSESRITNQIMENAGEDQFIGFPLEILNAKILDPSCPNRAVPDGMTGELCLRGDSVFLGYMNNPQATKEMLDEDGWLHTGDSVYRKPDGSYYIVGRLKEMIKYQGNQISPYELESIFRLHPDVKDAAVIGLPHEIFGELPAAVVVPAGVNLNLETEKLRQFVEDQINPSKRLRGGVYLCSSDFIPRTILGKVKRKELLRKVLANLENQTKNWLTDPVQQNGA